MIRQQAKKKWDSLSRLSLDSYAFGKMQSYFYYVHLLQALSA